VFFVVELVGVVLVGCFGYVGGYVFGVIGWFVCGVYVGELVGCCLSVLSL